jgi:hypothetical protein
MHANTLRRGAAIRMLLYHGVPAVRRLAKTDSVELLRAFYACRVIQRWSRVIFAFRGVAAPVARGDMSALGAMGHILACTTKGCITPGPGSDDPRVIAARAVDIRRLVHGMWHMSPGAALASCVFWTDLVLRDPRHQNVLRPIVESLRVPSKSASCAVQNKCAGRVKRYKGSEWRWLGSQSSRRSP